MSSHNQPPSSVTRQAVGIEQVYRAIQQLYGDIKYAGGDAAIRDVMEFARLYLSKEASNEHTLALVELQKKLIDKQIPEELIGHWVELEQLRQEVLEHGTQQNAIAGITLESEEERTDFVWRYISNNHTSESVLFSNGMQLNVAQEGRILLQYARADGEALTVGHALHHPQIGQAFQRAAAQIFADNQLSEAEARAIETAKQLIEQCADDGLSDRETRKILRALERVPNENTPNKGR